MDEKVAKEKEKIMNEIERLRRGHGPNTSLAEEWLHSPEVSDVSKRVDELIVKYMKIY